MRVVLLPFFLLSLGAALTPWALELIWAYRTRWLPLLCLLALVLTQGIALAKLSSTLPRLEVVQASPPPVLLPAITQSFLEERAAKPFTSETVAADLARLQEWLKLQPHHRDILVNLSILYALNNQPDQARAAFSEAQHLDPNAPIFSD